MLWGCVSLRIPHAVALQFPLSDDMALGFPSMAGQCGTNVNLQGQSKRPSQSCDGRLNTGETPSTVPPAAASSWMTNTVASLCIRKTALSLPTMNTRFEFRTNILPTFIDSGIFLDAFLAISSKLAPCRWQHYFPDDCKHRSWKPSSHPQWATCMSPQRMTTLMPSRSSNHST